MDSKIEIVYTNEIYADSYNKLVDEVAKERKFLSTVTGFPLDGSKWFIKHMSDNNYPQYFLIIDETVIGWCDMTPKDIPEFKHVGVLGMGIKKEYRRKGYGKKLLQTTIEHAKSICHLEKIELCVFETNELAINLYKSVGFTVEGKRLKSRKIDNAYDNEIEMGMFLD